MPARYNDPNIVRCTLAQYIQLLNGETVKGHTMDKTKYVYVVDVGNLCYIEVSDSITAAQRNYIINNPNVIIKYNDYFFVPQYSDTDTYYYYSCLAANSNDAFTMVIDTDPNILSVTVTRYKIIPSNATTSSAGLMSATDKSHLDTLYNFTQSQKDQFVDTIGEVLSVFQNFEEGGNIATILAGKADKVKIGNTEYNATNGVVSLPAYPTKSSWNYDDTYLKLTGGTMTGPLKWKDGTALPSKTLQYILGIDAFASGGETGWQSKSDFLSGYATETWVTNKGYATETWVNNKGYLTAHQSLAAYTTTINTFGLSATADRFTFDLATRKITNTTVRGSWDSQVYSNYGLKNDIYVSFRVGQTSSYIMVGLDSNPTETASYNKIDYCWYTQSGGSLNIYESGTPISISGHTTYTVGDEFRIEYSNGQIRYYHNGTLCRTVTRAVGDPLSFDSSFYNGGNIYAVQFGTMSHLDISGKAEKIKVGTTEYSTTNGVISLPAYPTVPTKVSQLTNDRGFTANTGTVTSVSVKVNGAVKGTVTTSGTIDLGTIGGSALYQHNITFATTEAGEPECCSFQLINNSPTLIQDQNALKAAMQVNKFYAAHGFVYELLTSGDSELDFPIITSICNDGTNIKFYYFSRTDDGTTISINLGVLDWIVDDNVVQIQ